MDGALFLHPSRRPAAITTSPAATIRVTIIKPIVANRPLHAITTPSAGPPLHVKLNASMSNTTVTSSGTLVLVRTV
jgi:hypothetical protein